MSFNINEYILSLSYGKDSLACLGAIEQLGWPIDRIVHAEVWATDAIPADLPPMVKFKKKADEIIKERYGIEVEHVRSEKTAEQIMFHRRVRGKNAGKIMGWPMIGGCELQVPLKIRPMNELQIGNVFYIGIAADEKKRFRNLTDTKKSPLIYVGWTEADCRRWCEDNDLLSPIYTTSARGGCWFCPNQPVGQLRILRKNYPDLWNLMLKWDSYSPFTFKAGSRGRPGHTIHDFERRFQMEDEHLISPDDRVFRWSMLDEPLNYRMF